MLRTTLLATALGTILLTGSLSAQAAGPATDWTLLHPAQQPARLAAMASAWDPVSGRFIIFGGYDANAYSKDTWAFDGQTWVKLVTPVSPSARAAASMAFDSVTQRVVLFGGFAGGGQYLNDTWLWDGATATWSPTTPALSPKGVTGPMVFTDPANGHADVYGGFDGYLLSAQGRTSGPARRGNCSRRRPVPSRARRRRSRSIPCTMTSSCLAASPA